MFASIMKRIGCAVFIVFCLTCICRSQTWVMPTDLNSKIVHSEQSGDLLTLLAFTATTFRVPMSVELVQPYPSHLILPAGNDTAAGVLNSLVAGSPGYAWESRAGVAVFYNVQLRKSAGNFLNNRIKMFVIPDNAADLKVELKEAMANPIGQNAGLIAGIRDPELAELKISKGKILSNITGRDIIVEASKENKKLFSVIVFPTANPTTKRQKEGAHANWYLRAASSLATNPLPIRSIATSASDVRGKRAQ